MKGERQGEQTYLSSWMAFFFGLSAVSYCGTFLHSPRKIIFFWFEWVLRSQNIRNLWIFSLYNQEKLHLIFADLLAGGCSVTASIQYSSIDAFNISCSIGYAVLQQSLCLCLHFKVNSFCLVIGSFVFYNMSCFLNGNFAE